MAPRFSAHVMPNPHKRTTVAVKRGRFEGLRDRLAIQNYTSSPDFVDAPWDDTNHLAQRDRIASFVSRSSARHLLEPLGSIRSRRRNMHIGIQELFTHPTRLKCPTIHAIYCYNKITMLCKLKMKDMWDSSLKLNFFGASSSASVWPKVLQSQDRDHQFFVRFFGLTKLTSVPR